MQITFDQKQLKDLFTEIVLITDNVSTKHYPSQTYVRLDSVDDFISFTASNSEISFFKKMKPNFGSDTSPGKFTLPAKDFLSLIKTLPEGDITISKQKNNVVEVTQENKRFTFLSIDPNNIDLMDEMPSESIPVNAEELSTAINTVSYAASKDEMRGALQGLLLEPIKEGFTRAVCSNGRVLVTHLFRTCLNNDVLLLAKPAQVLKKLIENKTDGISLCVDEASNFFWVKGLDFIIKVRVLAPKFPPYQKAMPTTVLHEISIPRIETIDALERVCLFGKDKERLTANLTFTDDGITYELSNNTNSATETVKNNTHCSVGLFEESVNPYYMLLNLLHLKGDVVSLELYGKMKPIVIKGNNTLTLVMPKRSNK